MNGCTHFCSLPIIVWLTVVALLSTVSPLVVERRRLPGIWRLQSEVLPFEPDIRSKLQGLLTDNGDHQEEILLKLNPDGSFKQCNEGYNEGRWMMGRWEVTDDWQLKLALRRQYFGPRFDVLLQGKLITDKNLKVQGDVQKGKFMYPHKHPAFFDYPLVNQESLGEFTLEQSIATFSVRPVRVQDPDKANRFERSDFYDRTFIMTIEPIESTTTVDAPVDIRAMPIRFFANNTFEALGTNKYLRGRFEITENDELSFQVSLFGMGRSVRGSVYSEGLGLTHEDERSYVGTIDETDGRFRVEGTVLFGTDMGSDARPEPVGKFILTETRVNAEEVLLDTDNDFGMFQ